jgi:hypothetical protein
MAEDSDNPFQTPPAGSVSVAMKVPRPFWSLMLWHALLAIGAGKFFFVAVPILRSVALNSDLQLPAIATSILSTPAIVSFGFFLGLQLTLFLYCLIMERQSGNPARDRWRRGWTLFTLFAFLFAALFFTSVPMLVAGP